MSVNPNIPAAPFTGSILVGGFNAGKLNCFVRITPPEPLGTFDVVEGTSPDAIASALYRFARKVAGAQASDVRWDFCTVESVEVTDDLRVFMDIVIRHLRDLARASELIAQAGLIEG